jgi:hypothetical protein
MEKASDAFAPGRKRKIPLWRWAVWWICLIFSLFLFYGLFAPFWFGLRVAAWAAEFRARRRRPRAAAGASR